MRTRRNIFIIIGGLLIMLNLLVDITQPGMFDPDEELSYNIGAFFGRHFLLIIGLILLRLAYKKHKQIKALTENDIEQDIRNIGQQQ